MFFFGNNFCEERNLDIENKISAEKYQDLTFGPYHPALECCVFEDYFTCY